MRFIFILINFFFLTQYTAGAQKSWHYGAYYSFGAAFNFHSSNQKPIIPSDVSSLGVHYSLDNGEKALGFQTAVGLKWNDLRYGLGDNYYMDNNIKWLELRLMCSLPMNKKSTIALGMAPRIALNYSWSFVYANRTGGGQTEYDQTINSESNINALNSAIVLTYQYQLHKHCFFHLNAEQDILQTFNEDVLFKNYDTAVNGEPELHLNSLLTNITGSIVFRIR
jgi:hypothetical protein